MKKITGFKCHFSQIYWKIFCSAYVPLRKKYDVSVGFGQGVSTYYSLDKVNSYKTVVWVNCDLKKENYNSRFDFPYYSRANKIVTVSRIGKDLFLEKHPECSHKTELIYDMISSKLIKKMSLTGPSYVDKFNGIRILTIGRLVQVKGYDFVLGACKKLKDEGINFKWYVIGEGPLLSQLKELGVALEVSDKIEFLGVFSNPYRYLKECDLYCQPSRHEGFGMAIAEAKILNKIVVATNFSVVHEQITNEENGIITEMNEKSLYKGLLSVISNQVDVNRIQSNISDEHVDTSNELSKINTLLTSL